MGTTARPASPTGAARGDVDWISVGAFLALAFAIAWACFIGLHALGLPFVVAGNVGMFGPAIAALAVRLVRREPLRGLGLWPLGPFRWYGVAYLIVPALTVLGAALEVLTRYQRWDPHVPALPAGAPITPTGLLLLSLIQVFTINAVLGVVSGMDEELGWRGHLLPRLSPLGGGAAAVTVGVIWGLWHAPVIVLYGMGALVGMPDTGIRSLAVAPFFLLTTVPLGVIYAWLRFRSGSVWPCALAHGMANAGLAALAQLALSAPASTLIGGPIGVLGLVPIWTVAAWLLATGRLRAP